MLDRKKPAAFSANASLAPMGRRRFVQSLVGSSALFGLTGCGEAVLEEPPLPPVGTIGRAALLAPLTGSQASLGQIMQHAASIGSGGLGNGPEIFVIDSGDTAASAAAAAQLALVEGANMITGPLLSSQARSVANAVGSDIPVIALTNDSSIAGGNLFVFGITPLQSAKSVMGFAASRGMRSIGVVVPSGRFGELSIAASRTVADGFGFTLVEPVISNDATGVIDALRRNGNGTLPDAVYLPVVGGAFEQQAQVLSDAGVQILGSDQWSAIDAPRINALQNAWFAAPDPVRFEAFAIALENQTGAEAGVVAGLTFDAVEMARLLGRIGQQNRRGLLRAAGFDGIVGPYRFTENGQCERGLAILKVVAGATNLVGNTAV